MGPVMVIDRRGKHGRRRGKRLALRQLSERARSCRQAQHAAMVALGVDRAQGVTAASAWSHVQNWTVPVGPDRKAIR